MYDLIMTIIGIALGIGALAPYVLKLKNIIKNVKEILDVPAAASDLSAVVDKVLADNVITDDEKVELAQAYAELKKQFNEAKELF